MELATALHHSRDVGSGKNDGLRAQKTVNSREDAVFFELFDEDTAGTRPDRLSDVRPQEQVQRHNVEQLVDSAPVVPSLDAPVPLMAEQLVDVLSLVAKYETEMDRLEDRILQGSPVSKADKEAWRRWVNNSSPSGSKRKKKKRRKRKLPKAGGRPVLGQGGCRARCCATTGLGSPWCASATDHGLRGGDSACARLRGADRGVPMPQIMEVFVVPQIMEEIMEVIQLGTKLLTCSLLCNDKCLGRQSRKLWRFRSFAQTSTGAVLGGCRHARCCA